MSHLFGVMTSTKACLLLVVVTLFLERPEKDRYLSGQFPLPDLFFTLAVIVLGTRVLLDRQQRRRLVLARATTKELAIFGLAIVLGAISLVAFVVLPASMTSAHQISKTWLHLFFLALAAILLGRVLSRNGLVSFVLVSYFLFSVVISTIVIVQALDQNLLHTGASEAIGLGSRLSGSFYRPYGTWSEPAYLGYSAVAAILIGLGLVGRGRVVFGTIGATISLIALVLSGSAGALILAPTLFVILLATGRLASRPLLLGLACLAAVTVVVLVPTPAGHYAVERVRNVVQGNDASVTFRHEVNDALVKIWDKAPYTGVGLGDTRFFLPQLVHLPFMPNLRLLAPSTNVYLALLAETGPGGVIALLGTLLVLLLRTRSQKDLEQLTRVLIVLIGLEFVLIGAFLLPPFWFWASLRLGLDREGAEAGGSI
jgi:O-antigen ligase